MTLGGQLYSGHSLDFIDCINIFKFHKPISEMYRSCSHCQVFFQLGDFTAAKRSLKKTYKLGGQQPEERENIIKTLQKGKNKQ